MDGKKMIAEINQEIAKLQKAREALVALYGDVEGAIKRGRGRPKGPTGTEKAVKPPRPNKTGKTRPRRNLKFNTSQEIKQIFVLNPKTKLKPNDIAEKILSVRRLDKEQIKKLKNTIHRNLDWYASKGQIKGDKKAGFLIKDGWADLKLQDRTY